MKWTYTILCITVMTFTARCEYAFEDISLIDLKVKNIFPDPLSEGGDKKVPRNTSVVVTFNKTIDVPKFREHMLNVTSVDGDKLGGDIAIKDKTLVFTPSSELLMKAETKYNIKVSDFVDTDGNTLKKVYSSFFETGVAADTEPPYLIKAKAQGKKVTAFFDEPLLNYKLQHDAITVYDMTTEQFIYGKACCENFSNKIVFTTEIPLNIDHKYRVKEQVQKGIVDLANNEIVIDKKGGCEIYPTPKYDTAPPFITQIRSDGQIKSITISFSEHIDVSNLLEHTNMGISLTRTQILNDDQICVSPRGGMSTCSLTIHDFTTSINYEYNEITINITSDSHLNYSITVILNKNAFKDLAGNRIVGNILLYENDQSIIYTCPATL